MFIFSAQNNALTITGSVRIVESSIKLSMIYHIQKKEYMNPDFFCKSPRPLSQDEAWHPREQHR